MRLNEVRNRVAEITALAQLDSLAIFAAGSYARHEASEHSDLDLFFVYDVEPTMQRRSGELELFAALIDIGRKMRLPEFSNDAQYLETHVCDDMLAVLGSPADDFNNFFTLRMLLLLESECIYGETSYQSIMRRIVASYYRDYPDHQASFNPWFLINDIARFWKTLLLNYENRRNQNGPETDKTKQKVKNFKLKFSRMTTCFATIAALGTFSAPVTEDKVVELMQLTPQERLAHVGTQRPDARPDVDRILEDYAWFLQMTGLPTPELEAQFNDKSHRQAMFDKANEYGNRMYELLAGLDRREGGATQMLRFLVI